MVNDSSAYPLERFRIHFNRDSLPFPDRLIASIVVAAVLWDNGGVLVDTECLFRKHSQNSNKN
jgi:hypothetical protein